MIAHRDRQAEVRCNYPFEEDKRVTNWTQRLTMSNSKLAVLGVTLGVAGRYPRESQVSEVVLLIPLIMPGVLLFWMHVLVQMTALCAYGDMLRESSARLPNALYFVGAALFTLRYPNFRNRLIADNWIARKIRHPRKYKVQRMMEPDFPTTNSRSAKRKIAMRLRKRIFCWTGGMVESWKLE